MTDESIEQVLKPNPSKTTIQYVGKALGLLFNLYIVAAMIFGSYYNWQYAQENGFVRWIFLGEIVPTAKATVWPYFVFFDKGKDVTFTDAEKENLNHFSASIHADSAATDILYAKNKDTITKSDVDQVINLRKTALSEAQAVSDSVLDKIHPDLKKHFKEEYQRGLVLGIRFFEVTLHKDTDFNEANELGLKWSRWYNSDKTRAEFKVPQ